MILVSAQFHCFSLHQILAYQGYQPKDYLPKSKTSTGKKIFSFQLVTWHWTARILSNSGKTREYHLPLAEI